MNLDIWRAIESNFYGNLEKLNQYSSIIDNLQIVDTAETAHIILH